MGPIRERIMSQKVLRTHVAANQLCEKGKPAEAMEKYAEARRLYEAIMKEGTRATQVWHGYAILLMRLGDFEAAQALMQQMRTLPMSEDDWFSLRVNYSICLWRKGELDRAIETIGRAAKTKKNSTLYTTMGMYMVDRARVTGDFDEATALCREAMDYDEEDAGALDNMGALYEAMMDRARADGDDARAAECRQSAKAYYEKAHAVNGRQITTIYALAKLCHGDGEDDRARELLASTENLFSAACAP